MNSRKISSNSRMLKPRLVKSNGSIRYGKRRFKSISSYNNWAKRYNSVPLYKPTGPKVFIGNLDKVSDKMNKALYLKSKIPQTQIIQKSNTFDKNGNVIYSGNLYEDVDYFSLFDKYKNNLEKYQNDLILNGTVELTMAYKMYGENQKRYRSFTSNVNNLLTEQLYEMLNAKLYNYFIVIPPEYIEEYTALSIKFKPTKKPIKYSIGKMVLNDISFMKLKHNIKANSEKITAKNCVAFYIKQMYAKQKKLIKKIKKFDFSSVKWTVNSFIDFLEEHKIPYTLYNRFLQVQYQNKHTNPNKIKKIFAIIANEHIYAVDKKEFKNLKNMKTDKYEITGIKYIDDINSKLPYYSENFTIVKHNIKKVIRKKDDENSGKYYYEVDRLLIKDDNDIYTLIVNNKKLVESYELFSKILEIVPLSFWYSIYTPLRSLCSSNGLNSTFTDNIDISIPPRFNDSNYEDDKDVKCIDKNKAYSYALSELNYIPVIDSTCIVTKYIKPDPACNIELYDFYHVKKINSVPAKMFMSAGWKFGYEIMHFIDDIEIDYYINTIKKENPFKGIIKKMYTIDPNLSKNIINIFIGSTFSKSNMQSIVYTDITNNKEEADQFGDYISFTNYDKCGYNLDVTKNVDENGNVSFEYNDDRSTYYSFFKRIDNNYKFQQSCKLIASIVHAYSKFNLIKMFNYLFKNDKNLKIAKINTDCIGFKSNIITEKKDGLYVKDTRILRFSKSMKGWKKEETKISKYTHYIQNLEEHNMIKYKKIKTCKNNEDDPYDKDINNLILCGQDISKSNVLANCLAGAGKSHFIRTKMLPYLNNLNEDLNILIFSAQYSVLDNYFDIVDKYDNLNIDVKVVQYYDMNPKLRKELQNYDYIIIDEFGLLNYKHYDMLYNYVSVYTYMYAFGDTRQQLPYNNKNDISPLENKNIRNILFDYYISLQTNYRNGYDANNYKDMYTGKFKITKYEKKLIGKIKQLNITYTNKMRDIINDKMIKKKKWKNVSFSINISKKKGAPKYETRSIYLKRGEKLISEISPKDDTSGYFKKMGIYNSMIYKINDYNNDIITLERNGTIYGIPAEKLFKNNKSYFRPAYAITSYKAQGMSIPYSDLGIHEWEQIRKYPRVLYTVISRIQDKPKVKLLKKALKKVDEKFTISFD